ncbi:hypothetical protein JZ751_027147 [Albula glossodonta]|uniref:PH domain-containing protein n=1 Tax=Albula glossodonta TaxID=121402 RepID=A0A8T2NGL8_9TELE|nr:hypothetical protein JZ751_027147 [Albula glossodonta]
MSESIVRKIQPFTIGTRLSVPSVPKCPDFEDAYLPSPAALDNCELQNSLNDQVSLYLGQSRIRPVSPQLSPTGAQVVADTEGHPEDPSKEDHLNRNGMSPTSAASRAIKKITISGSTESPGDTPSMVATVTSKPENVNNNNNNNNNTVSSVATTVPRIVGVSCENSPNSHLKVLLRKDIIAEDQRYEEEEGQDLKCFGDITTQTDQTSPPKDLSPNRALLMKEDPTCVSAHNDCSFTQCNTLFNREIRQAEAWIKGKLRDLKDGCDVQRCPLPLQDWEELSQTLQRDLKDFENTLIQLNQLACEQNPNSDLVKKQLSQLEDQWHTLKQTAANQSKALGGARNLQQFNRKADRLENWIKEKEEEQSLAGVLGENVDKIQLTRRILDLKQDEQQYRTLHEEINHLALKLEKQGKTEGKNISTRRKHINKMWLKVQSLLKDYHENLQLALEVSSFYQQADNIISAINQKRKSTSLMNDHENCADREIKEMASQITMLDVTVSQLSNLHPTLATRVTHKQGEVKDVWALLQKSVRSEGSDPAPSGCDFTREDADPPTVSWETFFSQDKEAHRIMGKEVKEEQNRLKGCTDAAQAFPVCGMWHLTSSPLCLSLSLSVSLQTLSWLKDNVAAALSTPGPEGCRSPPEDAASSHRETPEADTQEGQSSTGTDRARAEDFLGQLEQLWEELKRRHPSRGAELQDSRKLSLKVREELGAPTRPAAPRLLRSGPTRAPGSIKTSSNRRVIWREVPLHPLTLGTLSPLSLLAVSRWLFNVALHKDMGVLQDLHTLEAWLQTVGVTSRLSPPSEGDPEAVELLEGDRPLRVSPKQEEGGMRLQEEREEKHRHKKRAPRGRSLELQDPPTLTGFQDRAGLDEIPQQEPPEELRVTSPSQDEETRELLSQCSGLTMRVNHSLSLSAELSMDIMDMETDMAVKCEPDRSGLQGLQEQQDEMESLCPGRWPVLGEEVQATLQAWEELGRSLAENRGRLQQFVRLQDFFRNYLAMISWTEDTRACIFSESAMHRGKGNEAPVASELDLRIEKKFEEAQKHQRSRGKRKLGPEGDVISSEAVVPMATPQRSGSPRSACPQPKGGLVPGQEQRPPHEKPTTRPGRQDDARGGELTEGAGPADSESGPGRPSDSMEPPFLVLKESGAPSLGGTVNLILSFGSGGDSLLQVQDPGEKTEPPEPVHRAIAPLEESCSPPGLPSEAQTTPQSTSPTSPSVSQISSISFHTLPRSGSTPNSTVSSALSSIISSAPSSTFSSATTSTIGSTHSSTFSTAPISAFGSVPSMTFSSNPIPTVGSTSIMTFSSIPSSTHSSQKGRSKTRKRCAAQRIVGLGRQEGRSPSHNPVARGTNTWPLKERKRGTPPTVLIPAGPPHPVREPPVEGARAECANELRFSLSALPGGSGSSGETPTKHAKQHCRHLSLGSVLTFDLPKDLSLIPSIHDVITISPPGSADVITTSPAEPARPNLPGTIVQCTRKDQGQAQASSPSNQTRSLPTQSREAPNHSPQGQTTIRTDCLVPANRKDPPRDLNQTLPSEGPSDVQVRCHSGVVGLREDVRDQPTATLSPCGRGPEGSRKTSTPVEQRQSKPAVCGHGSTDHICPSVHTKIHQLSGHIFRPPIKSQIHKRDQPTANQNAPPCSVTAPAGHVIGQKGSVGAVGGAKLCCTRRGEGVFPDAPRKTVGRVLSLERVEAPPSPRTSVTAETAGVTTATATAETIRPDHRQFEEEEEELEDIWNQTNGYEQSTSASEACLTNQSEPEPGTTPTTETSPNPTPAQSRNVLYRTLEVPSTSASASNLLVAEFPLPASIQALLGYGSLRSPPEQPGRQKAPEVQMAPDPATAPEPTQPQRHSPHRRGRQVGRETEPEACPKMFHPHIDEEEGCIWCSDELKCLDTPQAPSVSVLPACMGTEETGQQPMSSQRSSSDIRQQGLTATTRGRCSSTREKDPEFQSMEGTVERKHTLERGKKTPCQAWLSSYALLFKRSLRFCKDREEALKSLESGLTLDLTGAQCSSAPECGVRPSCFSLRLQDGSEHLLCASSGSLMEEWMLKIQANAGVSQMESSVQLSGTLSMEPTFSTACTISQCAAADDITSSHSGTFEPCCARAKELIILAGDTPRETQWHHGTLEDLSSALTADSGKSAAGTQLPPPGPLDSNSQLPPVQPCLPDNQQCPSSSKQRSHSFTSEGGSSYSVTLFIGDQLSGTTPPDNRAESPSLIGQKRDPLPDNILPEKSSAASVPKSQNKSVFKKFFGKEGF